MLPSPSRLRPADLFTPVRPQADLRVVPENRRIALLLNANAKRVNDRVRDRMSGLVASHDLFYSTSLDQAKAQCEEIIAKRYHAVMVGGGDGTITHTMNLLIEASRKLGRGTRQSALPDLSILRLGTGNGLAHLTNSGKPVNDVMHLTNGALPKATPLRLVEDAASGWVFPFASLGYDARVLNDYIDVVDTTKTKFSRGLAKSLAGYFYALGTRTIPGELKSPKARIRMVAHGHSSIIDPETEEEIPLGAGATLFEGSARAVAMGTTPFYGYGLKALPFAQRRTDRFHVRVSSASISFLLSHLPSLWSGKLKSPDFVDFLVEGVRIESSVALPTQFAGDAVGGRTELDLRLSDRAFRLLDGTA